MELKLTLAHTKDKVNNENLIFILTLEFVEDDFIVVFTFEKHSNQNEILKKSYICFLRLLRKSVISSCELLRLSVDFIGFLFLKQ